MVRSIETGPKVIVFDETPKQLFVESMRSGVRGVGRAALVFDDLTIALGEFDNTISAVVTTVCPSLPLTEHPIEFLTKPLVERAHELGVPLGVVYDHPAVPSSVHLGRLDTMLSDPLKPATLDQKIAVWLRILNDERMPAADGAPLPASYIPVELTPQAIGKRLFLGGEPKMRLGTWIARRRPSDPGFYKLEAIWALGLWPGQVEEYVRDFCQLSMLDRRDGGGSAHIACYKKTDSRLWSIYNVADIALRVATQQDLSD